MDQAESNTPLIWVTGLSIAPEKGGRDGEAFLHPHNDSPVNRTLVFGRAF